jgi:hypothetical protein
MLGIVARWLTHEIAARHGDVFETVYRELRGGGPSRVSLIRLLKAATPLFRDAGGGRSSLVERVRDELLARWADVLPPLDGRMLRVDGVKLAARVDERFASPGAGWRLGARHAVDVLLAAESAEHVVAGRYLPVIGQLHVASATSLIGCMFWAHPDPDAQRSIHARDLPDPAVYVVNSSGRSARNRSAALPPGALFVDLQDDLAADPERALHLADLVVEPGDDGLEVCHAQRGIRLPLLDVLGSSLSAQSRRLFSLTPATAHSPRITIEDVVVAREQWTFDARDLEFASMRSAAERGGGLREWAVQHALPRFFFVRPPMHVEVKPLFCDLASPLYVEAFCKTVRATREGDGSLSITEMLPSFCDLWLADPDGHRYTSELRFVIRDPLAPAYGRT